MKDWANFIYDEGIVSDSALKLSELSGELYGVFKTFDDEKQQVEMLDIMASEAVKTSEIEGELLSREDVRSSLMTHMGMKSPRARDKRAENVALMILDAWRNFEMELSEQFIKELHAKLFSNSKYIHAGVYRASDQPMRIISGAIGREEVHYEAPPSSQVPREMERFVRWYNGFKPEGSMAKIIVKTAITHLYFESIHPFEDGNGRIGRALIDKCLSESMGKQLLMSVSSAIENDKKRYYEELEKAQATLEINDWILYFSQLLIGAQQGALDVLYFSINKTRFFDKYKDVMNDRQTKAINKMFDAGNDGFEGGMTAKKYMSINKCVKATATRDLRNLAEKGVLRQNLAGRSTSYTLNI